MPRLRRIGCTRFIAGCISGAKRKTNPVARRQATAWSGVNAVGTPSASSTSAEPQREVRLRLPCLAIFAPAAAATNATPVEMLKVPLASPPVPQVSTNAARSASVRGNVTAVARMASTNPASSSAVTPRAANAVRNAAICASGISFCESPRMLCIAARACARLRVACRSMRPVNTSVRGVMVFCVGKSASGVVSVCSPSRSSDSIEGSLSFVFSCVWRAIFAIPV